MRSTLRCVAECRHRIDAYESAADDNDHKLTLSLRIRIFDETDYGRYTCFASNRFGQTEASMLLSGQNQWPNFVKPRPRQQQCRSNVRFCCQNGNDIERVHRKILPFRQSRMLLRHCCRFLATMLPVSETTSNEISSFRQNRNKLKMFNLFWICRKDEISTLLPKRQQCRSNVRLCRKNRSTCSIRQCCFDIVAGVDGALVI